MATRSRSRTARRSLEPRRCRRRRGESEHCVGCCTRDAVLSPAPDNGRLDLGTSVVRDGHQLEELVPASHILLPDDPQAGCVELHRHDTGFEASPLEAADYAVERA